VEDLAKFFADIIEFIVGGVFFVASLLLLLHAGSPSSLESLNAGLESVPDNLGAMVPIAALAVVYAMGIIAEGTSRLICEWRLTQLTRQSLGRFKDPERDLVKRREKWRTRAGAHSPSLEAKINAQLKRLRIERALLLSSAIACLAFIIDRQALPAVITLVLAVTTGVLVEVRFRRFLDSIVDAYEATGIALVATKASG